MADTGLVHGPSEATYMDVASAGMPAEGLALVATLMAQSGRETAHILEQLYEGERRANERLRAENARLRRTLASAQRKIDRIFADPGPEFWDEGP